MHVSEAVASRTSIRAFSNVPVDTELLKTLLRKSSRAATGSNLQPWRVSVINGPSMQRFLHFLRDQPKQDHPAYDVYPAPLMELYRAKTKLRILDN